MKVHGLKPLQAPHVPLCLTACFKTFLEWQKRMRLKINYFCIQSSLTDSLRESLEEHKLPPPFPHKYASALDRLCKEGLDQ